MIPAHAIFCRKAGAILWTILCGLMASWVGWGHLQAGVPFQLLDINKQSAGSSPSDFVIFGDQILFVAEDARYGRELWKSDGTPEGTQIVKDINPGPSDSFYHSLSENHAVLNGELYFSANDGTHGLELWKTDGTSAGTRLVKNIATSSFDSYPSLAGVLHDNVIFFAEEGMGFNLWRTDGTLGGTIRLKNLADIQPYSFSEVPPRMMNGTIYFTFGGSHLWKTDGTAEGTQLVFDPSLSPGLVSLSLMNASGNQLFLRGTDGDHGSELWTSDGTAGGTHLAKDIWTGSTGSEPSTFSSAIINDEMVFSASDPDGGRELWISDGTEEGTARLADLRPGADSSNPGTFTPFQGSWYFLAEGIGSQRELWKTDGTSTGTALVFGQAEVSLGQLLDASEDRLFFTAWDVIHGRELWSTDGTTTGTQRVLDLHPGFSSGLPSPGFGLPRVLNGTLYFQADDGMAGPELWRSDGTQEGTSMLADIFSSTASSNPSGFESINGTTLFWADDGIHGSELWATDGTVPGTRLLKDTRPGSFSGAQHENFIRINGARGFFIGRDLWKTDGTEMGTAFVTTFERGMSDFVWAVLEIGGEHGLFQVFPGDTPEEWQLWRTDGTAAGTEMIYSFTRYPDRLFGSLIMWVGGIGYFVADDGVHGPELWRTDGTPEGTMLVRDIFPGTESSQISNIWELNGWAVFSADDGVHGGELWRSDGTVEGTVLVKDMTPGAGSTFPYAFGQPSSAGRMLLSVYGANGGLFDDATLWITDGTASGTQPIAVPDIGYFRGTHGSALVDDGWLFSADDGIHGWELWRTDGSSAGTQLLIDFIPGPEGSNPLPVADYGGYVLFNVHDHPGGPRLWKSDGTTPGTELFYPTSTGLPSTGLDPYSSLMTGNRLFFSGVSDEGGQELWVMPLDDTLDAHQSWLLKWFNDSSGIGATAPNADLNGNGVPILIEYALDVDPVGQEVLKGILPEPVVDSTGDCLTLSFQRCLDRTDITMTVQAADSPNGPWTDLAKSENGAGFVSLLTGVRIEESGASVRRHVKVCDVVSASMSPAGRRFMRLRVSR